MTVITITESGEQTGEIDTDAGSAEYSGDNPMVARLIEDLDEGIFTTTHDTDVVGEDVTGGGSTLPPDQSVEVKGDDLAEHVLNVLESLGVKADAE